jgi:hypothetical protein
MPSIIALTMRPATAVQRLRIGRLLALCGLALALLWQPWAMALDSIGAAGTIEVCTSTGFQRYDRDGQPIPSSRHHPHGDCCVGSTALPATAFDLPLSPAVHQAPARLLPAGVLGAEWLGALSRGPPLLPS